MQLARILLVAFVVAIPVLSKADADAEWMWFRASEAWFLTNGKAVLARDGERFRAELFDAADKEFLRVTLVGTWTDGKIQVTRHVAASDLGEATLSGTLARRCYSGPGGGKETIFLTNESEVVGLTRLLPASESCEARRITSP